MVAGGAAGVVAGGAAGVVAGGAAGVVAGGAAAWRRLGRRASAAWRSAWVRPSAL